MTKSTLLWWLFAVATFAVMAVAGILGFYGALWQQDLTFFGFAILGAYISCTAWMGVARNVDYDEVLYIADLMERAGLVGTFIGLALAFQALRHMGAGDEWKSELLAGVGTKFLTSIIGMISATALRVQVRLRGYNEA